MKQSAIKGRREIVYQIFTILHVKALHIKCYNKKTTVHYTFLLRSYLREQLQSEEN